MLGSTPMYLFLTAAFIFAPYVAYVILVMPHQNLLWFFAGAAGLFVPCVYNLVGSAVVEPGILPRNVNAPVPSPEHREDVTGVALKFCPVCNFWRPRRTKHCRACANCVEEFDHHCPWVGNCIGKRNYPHFSRFVFCATALALYTAFCSCLVLMRFIRKEYSSPAALDWSAAARHVVGFRWPTMLLLIYCLVMFLSLVGLFWNHAWLIYHGVNTNEQLRKKYAQHDNPYDKGCWRNFRNRFFRISIPPSKIPCQWISAEPSEITPLMEVHCTSKVDALFS